MIFRHSNLNLSLERKKESDVINVVNWWCDMNIKIERKWSVELV